MICITGLYAFSNHRNAERPIRDVEIIFEGDNNVYLSKDMVNKLLIQNYGSVLMEDKEKVVLNTIEKVLETHDMVKSAQVYLTIDDKLTSKIFQRQPIGRVKGNTTFYLDEDGKSMPLSKLHSARVPIITGEITGKSLDDVFEILKYINQDDFLRKNVIGIHIQSEEQYQLKFRVEDFVVNLGDVIDLERKFKNFKAFYAKALKDQSLKDYAVVSLEFDNQVVCTKI
ncbi:cell division protein FtsQ [Muriicola marianensis]|uniref:Cell division protein FtsQ n=2 Tax=Muriicola marianensis TaxID=1324801 RepID=A0ABQ1QUY5_9FLAO|nr:cell division protein FtsQ [Muriicola marianensis]